MASPAAAGSALSKYLRPRRIQITDVSTAALWGVTAATGALYLVQPFDWIKKTFFEKPDPEQQ